MVKKTVMALLLIWFVVILFMPKEELYYSIEKELINYDIEINEESRKEGIFSLTLKNVTIYVKGIPLITAEEITLSTLLFYTKINVEMLMSDESLQKVTPTQIDKITVSHGIWSPMNLEVEAEGPFGVLAGSIDLSEREVYLDFNETKSLDMLKSQLTQGEKGWLYETSF